MYLKHHTVLIYILYCINYRYMMLPLIINYHTVLTYISYYINYRYMIVPLFINYHTIFKMFLFSAHRRSVWIYKNGFSSVGGAGRPGRSPTQSLSQRLGARAVPPLKYIK